MFTTLRNLDICPFTNLYNFGVDADIVFIEDIFSKPCSSFHTSLSFKIKSHAAVHRLSVHNSCRSHCTQSAQTPMS